MSNKKELKKCSHDKKDCAACHSGMCIALENTEFKNKKCPFYMDEKTKLELIAECRVRLLEKGFIMKRWQ